MKPGHRTTEFWIIILTTIAAVATAVAGAVPPEWAAGCAALGGAAYAISRGLAKLGCGLAEDTADEPVGAEDPRPSSGPTGPGLIPVLIFGLGAILFLPGCGSIRQLTTARIEIQAGTNRVPIVQPKDTVVRNLTYNPATGAIELTGYSSAANAAALAAQQAQSEAIATSFREGFGSAMATADKLVAAYLHTPAPAAASSVAPPTNGLLTRGETFDFYSNLTSPKP